VGRKEAFLNPLPGIVFLGGDLNRALLRDRSILVGRVLLPYREKES
jgi:hypothetical protein